MTDNEIIKALECCTTKAGCVECPLYVPEVTGSCVKSVFVNSLALIKRQKTEIERLHNKIKEKNETITFLKDQATGWSIDFCNLKSKLKTAKYEAIKEFTERLKEAPIKMGIPLLGLQTKSEIEEYFNGILIQFRDAIESVAKEMTGEKT